MERTIHDEIQILKNFVEGKISAGDFEHQVYTNHALEKVLSDPVIDWHGTYLQHSNVFLYVCEQNFSTAAGVLNIHGAIQLFLSKTGEQALPSHKYADDFEIITGISPEYIDADPEFIKNTLYLQTIPFQKQIGKNISDNAIPNFLSIRANRLTGYKILSGL